jgi:LemA protein
VVAYLALAVAAVAVLGGGAFGLLFWRRLWLIADLPTSRAAHAFLGTNEVVGRAVPVGDALVAPWSASECVWYRARHEREVATGNNRRWKVETDESSSAPFWVEDASGRILVQPKGANVDAPCMHRRTQGGRPERFSRLAALTPGVLLGGLSLDAANHRTIEWQLRPGDPVYVLGDTRLRRDEVALEFFSGSRLLLIAAGDDVQAEKRTRLLSWILLLAAVAGAVGLPAAWHAVRTHPELPPAPGTPSTIEAAGGAMAAAAAIVLGILVLLYIVRLFNRLVSVRNRVLAAQGLIDVQLQRRHDLIPALVELVRAAAGQERATQVGVAAERAPHAELVALVEAYPELTSTERFRALADELTFTEDAVAFARGFELDARNVFEDRRRTFPGLFFAPFVRLPAPAPPLAGLEGDGRLTPRG